MEAPGSNPMTGTLPRSERQGAGPKVPVFQMRCTESIDGQGTKNRLEILLGVVNPFPSELLVKTGGSSVTSSASCWDPSFELELGVERLDDVCFSRFCWRTPPRRGFVARPSCASQKSVLESHVSCVLKEYRMFRHIGRVETITGALFHKKYQARATSPNGCKLKSGPVLVSSPLSSNYCHFGTHFFAQLAHP